MKSMGILKVMYYCKSCMGTNLKMNMWSYRSKSILYKVLIL